MQTPLARILVDIGMFVGVLVLPWYISVLALVGLIVYYPVYIEGLFFAFLFDTLYSSQLTFPFTALTIASVFVLIVFFVRTRIRT